MFKDFLQFKSITSPIIIMIATLFVVGCSKKIAPVGGSAGLSNDGSASASSKSSSGGATPGKSSPGNRGGEGSSSNGDVSDSAMSKGTSPKGSTSEGGVSEGNPSEGTAKKGNGAQQDSIASNKSNGTSKSSGHDSRGHKGSDEGMNMGPSFMENVYFDYDKAQVRLDAKATLEENSRWLALNSHVKIQIEGHGDERGTNDYNLALGERRARSIMRYLINLGINESRFSFISYGEEKSVCSEKVEACYQKNRRVHFLVKR